MRGKDNPDYTSRDLIETLYKHGLIQTWYRDKPDGWKLRPDKGKLYWTPYYINLRPICSYKDSDKILEMIGTLVTEKIEKEAGYINKVVGVGLSGIPISTSVTSFGGIPSCWTRSILGVKTVEDLERTIKEYGGHNLVEGKIESGDVLAIVDDVITRGGSKMITKKQIDYEIKKREKTMGKLDVKCKNVIVVIDREEGGLENIKEYGMMLHSIARISECVEMLKDRMHAKEHEVLEAYMEDYKKFQDIETQRELKKLAMKNSYMKKSL